MRRHLLFRCQRIYFSGGVYSTVAIPQASDTFLYYISDAGGIISGIYFNASGPTALQHGFIGVPR
jgi:hypothetical protein